MTTQNHTAKAAQTQPAAYTPTPWHERPLTPWEFGRSILADLGEPPHVWHGAHDKPDLSKQHWVRIDGTEFTPCALALGRTISEARFRAYFVVRACNSHAANEAKIRAMTGLLERCVVSLETTAALYPAAGFDGLAALAKEVRASLDLAKEAS